jgi:hypothetical protein
MINFIDEDNIQFLWRDKTGIIHAQPLFKTDKMRETLDILNPGEVWLNYSREEIIEKLSGSQEGVNA